LFGKVGKVGSTVERGHFGGKVTDELPQPNAAIVSAVFATDGLPLSKQFDAYQEFCAPVIDVWPSEGSRSGFDASCEMWKFGRLALRRIHTPAGQFARSATQVQRDGLDHWVFNVIQDGTQEVRATSGSLKTGAGVLSVFSLAGPYHARRTNVDWLGLFVPRGFFPTIDASFNHNRHLALDHPLGRVLAAYLVSLADELPYMTEDDLPHALQATQAIVANCATSAPGVLDSEDTCFDLPRMRHIRDIIDKNLGSWNLHTGRICKLAGVSRSSLYRMFEPYGGVVRYVQRQRLRRAHDLLADPTCIRKISLIANDYCFSDSSTFSRAFRQEFGYSPRDLKRRSEGRNTSLCPSQSPQQTKAGGGWDTLFDS
jgi:AraC-like DNA-binding protein